MTGKTLGMLGLKIDRALFINQVGVSIVERGGRIYLRGRSLQREESDKDAYEEVEPNVRVIVAAGYGFVVTANAIGVCAKRHIELVITDYAQSFTAIYAAYPQTNASRAGMAMRLRQFEAVCDVRKTVAIAKDIVQRKIVEEKHDRNSKNLFFANLENCGTVESVRHVEAKSSYMYWHQWKDFELEFAKGFDPPKQWRSFKTRYIGRPQGKSGELPRQFTARFAETPLQAMHNFAVSVTAIRLVRVIAARGLDPCWGFLHNGKKPGRYSLAWDALEVLRPSLATAVFKYAGSRRFRRGDFASQDGVVRLSSHIAKECMDVTEKTAPIERLVQAVKGIEKELGNNDHKQLPGGGLKVAITDSGRWYRLTPLFPEFDRNKFHD